MITLVLKHVAVYPITNYVINIIFRRIIILPYIVNLNLPRSVRITFCVMWKLNIICNRPLDFFVFVLERQRLTKSLRFWISQWRLEFIA